MRNCLVHKLAHPPFLSFKTLLQNILKCEFSIHPNLLLVVKAVVFNVFAVLTFHIVSSFWTVLCVNGDVWERIKSSCRFSFSCLKHTHVFSCYECSSLICVHLLWRITRLKAIPAASQLQLFLNYPVQEWVKICPVRYQNFSSVKMFIVFSRSPCCQHLHFSETSYNLVFLSNISPSWNPQLLDLDTNAPSSSNSSSNHIS